MRLQRACGAAMMLGTLLLTSAGLWHFTTGRVAATAQHAMADEWAEHIASTSLAPGAPPPALQVASAGEPVPLPDDAAVALLDIRRPGFGPLLGGALFVGEGVGKQQLDRGPGHFPGSALPGQAGNFAIAGHRTTHGAPLADLDRLRPGDEIHVTDRAGQRHLYRVLEQRIVNPADTWVVGPDPLGRGRPTLTLTTCHPRYSARQRLVVWAELA